MAEKVWNKEGFQEFMKGTLGNGGQNIYVSAKGVLQRIHQYDINGSGYPDLLFANSHAMGERPKLHLYNNPFQDEPVDLRARGTFDAVMADITGDGKLDLIVACQHDGVHSDVTSQVYFSSPEGYTEKYMTELIAPGAVSVAAGDFRGRGKNDLVFAGGGRLRIFEQTELGIEACKFRDIESDAISISAGDMDGDGYCDLYVLKQDGKMRIYWGGKDGLDADRYLELEHTTYVNNEINTTTLGRLSMRRLPWCTAVLDIDGKKCLFRADNGDAVFEYFTKDREIKTFLRVHAKGAVHAAVGDVNGDGKTDIAIAVQTDRDKTENSILLLGRDNYNESKAKTFLSRGARTLTISPLKKGERNYLFVAQTSTREQHTVTSQILGFNKDGNIDTKHEIISHCAARICVGDTGLAGNYQVVSINHEAERVLGKENIYIYLGGEDGYKPDRRIELPGLAAVEGQMIDFNDNGYPDVAVVNCGENAPHLCKGIYIYHNDGDGPDINKREDIPAILPHGIAVGDFRHSGYLDIATAGIKNREVRIYEGGPDGYSADRVKKVVLGPNPETFIPYPWDKEDVDPDYSDEEKKILVDFGCIRWLFAADFNGDGYLDLFISQGSGANCMILWGGPDGFSADNMQLLATDGAICANVADLNGNGYPDLILGSHLSTKKNSKYEAYITIYWNGPDGFCENRKTCLPAWCTNSLTIGDFNGDGALDIFGTSYNNGRIRDLDSFIYYGDKEKGFSIDRRDRIFNHSGCGCLSGDFNGNGYIDLAVASHKKEGNHICESYIYWGGPDGINENRKTALPTIGCHGMTTVDIGNIMDRSDDEYYYSEIYKVPDGTQTDRAEWDAETGKTYEVYMQVRSADSEEAVENAEWSGRIENGSSIKEFVSGSYIQYRLILTAKSGCGTPRVKSVKIYFK